MGLALWDGNGLKDTTYNADVRRWRRESRLVRAALGVVTLLFLGLVAYAMANQWCIDMLGR